MLNYKPRVAKFGLSNLLIEITPTMQQFKVLKIMRTGGYTAIKYIYNLPITSKVIVYGYGINLKQIKQNNRAIKLIHNLLVLPLG